MIGKEKPTLAELEKLVELAFAEAEQARDELTLANFKYAQAKVEFQDAETARGSARRKSDDAEAKAVAARFNYVAATLEHDQNRKGAEAIRRLAVELAERGNRH